MQIDWSTGETESPFESQRADVVGGIFDARTFERACCPHRSGATGMDGIDARGGPGTCLDQRAAARP